jgi:hypothetical protein
VTLLYTDGFDTQDLADRWVVTNGLTSLAATPRVGSGSAVSKTQSSIGHARRSFAESGTVIIGFAYKINFSNTTSFTLALAGLYGDAGATHHLYIGVESGTNRIQIRRGPDWAGTILATSTEAIPVDQWVYIEIKAKLSDTIGTCEVKMNGVSVVSFGPGDTRNGGTLATFSSVMIGSLANFGSAGSCFWDDLYICDDVDATGTQGAPMNTYLGDVRIRTLMPSAAGSSTQLTPTGSANNWDNVNDIPRAGGTYNTGDAVAELDLYATPDPSIPGGETVIAAAVKWVALRDNTGARGMKAAVKSTGAVQYGATRALSTASTAYEDIFVEDPTTSAAWTVAAIDSLEIGAEVAS